MAGTTVRSGEQGKQAVTNSSTQIMAACTYIPQGLILRNRSTTVTVYLLFGSGTATTDGLELKAGESLILGGPGAPVGDRIAGITSAGSADINFVRWG